jgi:ADP-heptose:LPS heptosyltransferase
MIKRLLIRFGHSVVRLLSQLLLPVADLPNGVNHYPSPNKILLVAPIAIGDFIIAAQAIAATRKLFPSCHIYLLAQENQANIEIVQRLNIVNSTGILSSSTSVLDFIKLIFKVHAFKPDAVVCMEPGDNKFIALLLLVSRARTRVGIVSADTWNSQYSYLFNVGLRSEKNESERYLRTIRPLASSEKWDTLLPIDVNYSISEVELTIFKQWIRGRFDCRSKLICIQAGSSKHQKWKRWPEHHFRDLINKLLILPDVSVIVVGGKDDIDVSKSIISKEHCRAISLAGELSISQTILCAQLSDAIVCNDSSCMHIASLLKKPAIVLYGPTDPLRTKPISQDIIAMRTGICCSPCFTPMDSSRAENCTIAYRCLTELFPDTVLKKVMEILSIK